MFYNNLNKLFQKCCMEIHVTILVFKNNCPMYCYNIHQELNEKCIKNFHVDNFHLKPKNIKNIEHCTKDPRFSKYTKNTEQLLYIDVLINPGNFRTGMITSQKHCLDKVIYRLGEFDNFILMLAVFPIFRVNNKIVN